MEPKPQISGEGNTSSEAAMKIDILTQFPIAGGFESVICQPSGCQHRRCQYINSDKKGLCSFNY